jgi:hypothetical protein
MTWSGLLHFLKEAEADASSASPKTALPEVRRSKPKASLGRSTDVFRPLRSHMTILWLK